MNEYSISWITDMLAAGHAPMSYDDLQLIQAKGIGAIVNLCAEYCDLHDIEDKAGFEVYYLPIVDECAPEMESLEQALDWVENQQARGRRVLVHCRFGIGRTGTFLLAYLLRKGVPLKKGEKLLRKSGARAWPSCYGQWKMLKKYRKKLES